MKLKQIISLLFIYHLKQTNSIRLHKLFQYIDGFKSVYNLEGFLHVGEDYAVFLRAPKPHDKNLIYELYEAKNVPEIGTFKPRLLAISKVPIEYIKSQLKVFREELYKAKYVDENVVPGTEVRSLREWQIDRALNFRDDAGVDERLPILRTIL